MTQPYGSFAADLLADARRYISKSFGDLDYSDLPADTVRNIIDKIYLGGWQDFEATFRRLHDTAPTKSEEWSPVKVKLRAQEVLGRNSRRLGTYDEIKSYTFTDTLVKLVISRAEVEYRTRRDIITGRTLELHQWTRETTSSHWKHDYIEAPESQTEEWVRWGAINTPERAASKREQVETCYRPGTERTPLDGPARKLEVSHKEYFANETYPIVKKKQTTKKG